MMEASPVRSLSADELGELFEYSREGIILADLNWMTTHWNQAALAMHGLPPREYPRGPIHLRDLAGKFLFKSLDGSEIPFPEWPLHRVLRGENLRDLELLVRLTELGQERFFCFSGCLIGSLEKPKFAALYIQDRTHERASRRALSLQSQRQSLLLRCSQMLLTVSRVEATLIHKLFDIVREAIPAEFSFHYRVSRPNATLSLICGPGLTEEQQQSASSLSFGETFCGQIAQTRAPLRADSLRIRQDPNGALACALGLRAYAGFPLLAHNGTLFGTLAFASRLVDGFDEEEFLALETLSHMVTVALERIEAEGAHQRSESQFRQLSESLPQLIWTSTADGVTDFVGPQWSAYTHAPTESLLGDGWTQYIHPDDKARVLSLWAEVRRQESSVLAEMRLRRHDGEYRWFTVSAVPLKDERGKVLKWFGTNADIHESRVARDEIAAREDRLRLVLGQLPILLWSTDAELRITFSGGLLVRQLGFRPEDSLGRLVHDILPKNSAYNRQIHQAALAGESTLIHDSFHGFDFYGGLFPLRDSQGDIIGTLGFIEDVTQQRTAEREVMRLNAELENRVKERTAELEAANRELESFSYAVSHDLRAPLRAMSGFSQALTEDYGHLLPEEALLFLYKINRAGREMGDLIEALLSLSRHTRSPLTRDFFDLSALADDLWRDLNQTEPGWSGEWSAEPNLTAYGDRRLISIALRNLLSNARKYSVRAEIARVRLFASEQDGQRGFCVSDNGAGFSMRHAGKLFLPFQRLHRQDEFPGIGIGLATVKRIIQRHGGVVSAVSSPGEGATFFVSLPSATPTGRTS